MARYIDLEELAKRITENIKADAPEEKGLIEWCKDECIRQGYAMPTADVVPKSEVEEIIYKLECLLCHATGNKLSKHTYDLRTMEAVVTDYIDESYAEGRRDAKSEVARGIFEEIARNECHDISGKTTMYMLFAEEFAELKKKYTEGKENV